jgi:hypothetical protein
MVVWKTAFLAGWASNPRICDLRRGNYVIIFCTNFLYGYGTAEETQAITDAAHAAIMACPGLTIWVAHYRGFQLSLDAWLPDYSGTIKSHAFYNNPPPNDIIWWFTYPYESNFRPKTVKILVEDMPKIDTSLGPATGSSSASYFEGDVDILRAKLASYGTPGPNSGPDVSEGTFYSHDGFAGMIC